MSAHRGEAAPTLHLWLWRLLHDVAGSPDAHRSLAKLFSWCAATWLVQGWIGPRYWLAMALLALAAARYLRSPVHRGRTS